MDESNLPPEKFIPDDDFQIENIMDPLTRKKTIKSGHKGKRKERELVKLLTARFGPGFSRSIGSGNRWGQVTNLPRHAQDTFSGDLVCPEDFKWVFECKGGYNEIDLNNAFVGGITELDTFLKQAGDESARTGRNPMLCWKKDRRPWLAFLRSVDFPSDFSPQYRLFYRDWVCVSLEELLKSTQDHFWRKGKDK